MKDNKRWFGIGIALLAVIITRQILNGMGGIRSFPYLIQIIFIIFLPVLFYLILKKEKKKMNDQQYKYLKVIFIFINIIAVVISIIIILNNSFPNIWTEYRNLLLVITLGLFILFPLYLIILVATNIKK